MVGRSSNVTDKGVPSRPSIGPKLTVMSASRRCRRMNDSDSGSRRASSASTCSRVYPRSRVSRRTFHSRRIRSPGSTYTVTSKHARDSLVCSGSSPSAMTTSRGSTSRGRASSPVEWSYTGLSTGSPMASSCRCCSMICM